MLRYIASVACMLAPLLLGPAAAAPVEMGPGIDDFSATYTRDEARVDTPYVGEYCPPHPYRILCAGPISDRSVVVPVGQTGVGASENDTFAVLVVDQDRSQPYGPYIVQVPYPGEDVRICYWQCLAPNPLYLRAHANATLDVWVADRHVVDRETNTTLTLGGDGWLPLPAAFGCDRPGGYCDE